MSIKPSAAVEVRRLLAALGGNEVKREAAVARLSVIGARAVEHLIAEYWKPECPAHVRAAILRVLEAIADPRSLPLARKAVGQGGETGVAAIATLRALLVSPAMDAATEALDGLLAVVLDRHEERNIRIAAFEALRESPGHVHERVAASMRDEPDALLKAHVDQAQREPSPDARWPDALAGRVEGDPRPLIEAARRNAATAPLGALQKLIDSAHQQESAPGTSADRAASWRALRGVLHHELAKRGSTVALYDLRETLNGATALLPPTLVAAAELIGDESCLEAIAAAHAGSDDRASREQLANAFHAIVKRERVTRRSAVLRRVAVRSPELAERVSTPSRTRPRPTRRRRT